MRFTLGGRRYDLTTRSLVIGRASDPQTARRLVDDGADVIEVADPDLVAAFVAAFAAVHDVHDVPVAIASAQLDAVRAAYQAGAVLGACPDPAFLALSAEAGAAVLTPDPTPARAAGIPADRIAVEWPAGARPAATHPHATLVTTDDLGATALAVTNGARLIRTANVKAARRVADVLAAILEAP
ncbi:MAG: hypothetical protein ACRD2W_02980 [Acidimicrobiales bacterium]